MKPREGLNGSVCSARTHLGLHTGLAALGGGAMSQLSDAHVAFLPEPPGNLCYRPQPSRPRMEHPLKALSPRDRNSYSLPSYAITACLLLRRGHWDTHPARCTSRGCVRERKTKLFADKIIFVAISPAAQKVG